MRDIFNLMKHQNHDVKVIEYNGSVRIGCVSCGITLYDFNSNISSEDVDLIIKEYKTLESSNLTKSIEKLVIKSLTLSDEELKNIIYEQYGQATVYFDRYCEEEYTNSLQDYDYYFNLSKVIINALTNKFENLYAEDINKLIDNICYPSLLIERAKGRLISIAKELLEEERWHNLDIVNPKLKSSVIYSNKEITSKDPDRAIIINKKYLEKAEEAYPTAKDIYTFKDYEEFSNMIPDYDDETGEHANYREFIYRLKNGLYDFSNVELEKVYDYILKYLEDVDCISRQIELLRFLLIDNFKL